MASGLVHQGSPLDDYFRDEEIKLSENLFTVLNARNTHEQNHVMSEGEGDKTMSKTSPTLNESIRSSSSSPERWTGVIPNTAGPSTPTASPTRCLSQSGSELESGSSSVDIEETLDEQSDPMNIHSKSRMKEEDYPEFEEKFKYQICSSGILEREYVACLNFGSRRIVSTLEGEDNILSEKSQEEVANEDRPDDNDTHSSLTPPPLFQFWMEICRRTTYELSKLVIQRKDIGVAGLAVLVGLLILVGIGRFLIILALGIGSGVFTYGKILGSQNYIPNQHLDEDSLNPGKPLSDSTMATKLSSPPTNLDSSLVPVQDDLLSNSSQTLKSLSTFLESSRSLDQIIESSLNILQPHSADSEIHQKLKLAIHRSTENMTDHLASSISNLVPMVDENELKVLGGMYDIPLTGVNSTRRSRGRKRSSESSDDEISNSRSQSRMLDLDVETSIPPPKSRDYQATSDISKVPELSSLPISTSHSYPGRPKSKPKPKHSLHLSLPNFNPTNEIEDRYTPFPVRTPRTSKRSSWSNGLSGLHSSSGSIFDIDSDRLGTPTSRPSHYRRIAETDEEVEVLLPALDDDMEGEIGSGHSESGYSEINSNDNRANGHSTAVDESVTNISGPNSPEKHFSLSPTLIRSSSLSKTFNRSHDYTPRRSSPLRKRRSGDLLSSSSSSLSSLSDYPRRHIMPIVPHSSNMTPQPKRMNGTLTPLLPSPIPLKRSKETTSTPVSIPITLSMSSPQPIPLNLPVSHSRTNSLSNLIPKTPMSANPKRRSLQNIQYYHTPSLDPLSPGTNSKAVALGRTKSLQYSDLQVLRTRSSTISSKPTVHHFRNDDLNRNGPVSASVLDDTRRGMGHRMVYSTSLSIPRTPHYPEYYHQFQDPASTSTVPPTPIPDTSSSPMRSLPTSASAPISIPIPTTFRPRSVSNNPRTLPGLKAACLGVHLRRRKLGCYLLGLRFEHSQDLSKDSSSHADEKEQYWLEVRRILDELNEAIRREVEDLRIAENEAIEVERISQREAMEKALLSPPWKRSRDSGINGHLNCNGDIRTSTSTFASGSGITSNGVMMDYAPRISDQDNLQEQVNAIEQGLENAWNDLRNVKRLLGNPNLQDDSHGSLAAGMTLDQALAPSSEANPISIEAAWGRVRRGLATMIRDWERGKEVVNRLQGFANGKHYESFKTVNGSHDLDDLPDFLKAWKGDSNGISTGFDGTENTHHPDRRVPSLSMTMTGTGSTRSTSIRTDVDMGFGSDEESEVEVRQANGSQNQDKDQDQDQDSDTTKREMTDYLPPQGIDDVFEDMNDIPIFISSEKEVLKKLSRDERIKLSKEARERGLRIEDMLRMNGMINNGNGNVVPNSVSDDELGRRRRMEGEIVGELKGMIGLIRKKKGIGEELEGGSGSSSKLGEEVIVNGQSGTSNTNHENNELNSKSEINGRVNHLSKGIVEPTSSNSNQNQGGIPDFREELKAAFVFPRNRTRTGS